MNTKLPEGWVEAKISDVAKIASGGTPSTSNASYFDGDIPWITPVDLSGYKRKYINKGRRTLSESGLNNSSAKLLPRNTVLFSSRAPIGYVAIAKINLATNQGFKNLLPNEFYDPSYAYYYLKFIKDYAESQASGTTFKELSGSKMGELPFLLAPLKEQKRIADKLDNLYHHLDALNERLDKIPVLLKQFRENVLTQAIAGKLIDVEFSFKKLGDLIVDIKYGTSKKSDYKTLGVPVLRIPNIKGDGTIDTSDLKYAMLDKSEEAKLKLKENDILLIRSNGSVSILGRSALVNKEITGFVYAGYLIRVRCNEKLILPAYLNLVLASPVIRKVIEGNARSTTGVNNINSEEVKALLIPFPTLENQRLIVAKVEQLFLIADTIERHYLTLNDTFNNLPSTILSKAFKGELVDQNPEDEPASVLLQKITQMKTK